MKGKFPFMGSVRGGLAPSVGARAGGASATSNAHPLRHPKLARTGRHYNDLGDRTDTSSDDRDVGRIDTLSVMQVKIGLFDPESYNCGDGINTFSV